MAGPLFLTTHTRALTAAYRPSTSVAMAINPNSGAEPPTCSKVVATGLGQNVRTPEMQWEKQSKYDSKMQDEVASHQQFFTQTV